MLQMIALDLDGTFLHDDKGITQRSMDILARYAEQGVHIVVASGRAFSSLPQEVFRIPGLEYIITSNGVSICRRSTGETLFHETLNADSAREIVRVIGENNCIFETFVEGVPYAERVHVEDPSQIGSYGFSAEYFQRTRRPVDGLAEFTIQHIEDLDCIDLIVPKNNLARKQELIEQLKDIPNLYLTSSVPHLIEISDVSAGKGAALRRLAEYLDIPREQIAAFGNAENDVDMMTYAGIGVAVANSPMDVKLQADVITLSNNEDGVAFFLEQVFGQI